MVSEWAQQKGIKDSESYDPHSTEQDGLNLEQPFQENVGEVEFKTKTATIVAFEDDSG